MNALVSDFDAIFQLAGGHQSGLFKLMGESEELVQHQTYLLSLKIKPFIQYAGKFL